ncbi:probable pectinesterase/pectinesterase inhibitor 20 [Phalaenopsis equestris]|uniref:probable pectinesterase/pectinesterase inhibitor 20 n=1 Tax=Phalaenopsis equestris TaxID=78828 RepID=UPI0009E25AB2|nr:probable pectinesterase/pectinesterase inhibitor 20 [Phalaenopsis equestris]
MNPTFITFFLLSFLTLTLAQLSSPPPPSTTPIPPSTACNSTPDPSFCRSILPHNGSQPLYSYGRFSLSKSLANAYKFLSLIDRYLGRSLSLPTPTTRALEDCHLLAGLNIDFLASACSALNSTSTALLDPEAEQLQTLLSALLTNQQTCLEGLEDADKANAAAGILAPSIVNGTKFYSVSLALFTKAWVSNRRKSKKSPLIKRLATVFHPTAVRRNLLFHEVEIGSDGELPLRMSEANRAVVERRTGRRLLQSSDSVLVSATVVVSQDGTGNFTTISDAVAAAPNKTDGSDGYYLIVVSAGVYSEYVTVPKNKRYIMMIGEGINRTVVTGNHNNVDGWTTFNSATFAVVGQGFVAINMTFQNTAGAVKHQAVALRNSADLSTFYHCSFEGYQDTLYTHSMRQFYTQCDIYGTVDYIFGNSAVVFQNCNMYSRLPMQGQQNTITAQGRIDPNQNSGISIQGGGFLPSDDLAADNGSTQTYLGRPWKQYSRTVIMRAFMGGLIEPAGWLEWDGDFALGTLYYAEYDNSGPGSDTSGRVGWAGYHVLRNGSDAANFTVSNFIMGDDWLPRTGVPYSGGLV